MTVTMVLLMRPGEPGSVAGPAPHLLPRSPWAALSGVLGLALWLYWSTVVAQLPALGFRFTPNQLFWLAALPALAMACARVVGALLPPVVAGSEWTAWASAGLLPLAVGIGTLTQQAETPYEAMVLLALLCGTGAALFVDAITPRGAGLAEQAGVLRRRSHWPLCGLMLGHFGSLIGFAAALPLLAASLWPEAVALAWTGAPIAALLQPLGAYAAERFGAARTTLWAFVAMAVAAAGLGLAPTGGVFEGCTALLFAAAGVGSGSTFRMIPIVFREQPQQAAAATGFAVAVAAFGGFFVPKALGSSLLLTGEPTAALVAFILFYLACIGATWWFFGRRFAPTPC